MRMVERFLLATERFFLYLPSQVSVISFCPEVTIVHDCFCAAGTFLHRPLLLFKGVESQRWKQFYTFLQNSDYRKYFFISQICYTTSSIQTSLIKHAMAEIKASSLTKINGISEKPGDRQAKTVTGTLGPSPVSH